MPLSQNRPNIVELRSRLVKCCLVFSVFFIGFFCYANTLFQGLAQPLLHYLPQGHLIAINLTTPLITPIRLSFVLAVMMSLPFLVYQLWAFIAPGLYQDERALMTQLVIPSILLFYTGLVFAYTIVFPMVFHFFVRFIPNVVQLTPDMGQYFDFILQLSLAFGLVFEIPLILSVLVKLGLTTPEQLRQFRPYFIVIALTVGMLLTPPDVLSQLLLALPMWGLYEFGIFLSQLYRVKTATQQNHRNGDRSMTK